jgi:hypothetical protein
VTSFHHQPEAQHPKSSAIHKPQADYPIYQGQSRSRTIISNRSFMTDFVEEVGA